MRLLTMACMMPSCRAGQERPGKRAENVDDRLEKRHSVITRSDEHLMQALARQDMAALGELVRRHQRFVWGVAYQFLSDASEAEDVAQETFLRLLKAAPRYRPTASLRSYLFRIASRLAMDVGRRRQRLQTEGSSPDTADVRATPSQAASAHEDAAQVRHALCRLPPRQQMAVIGKYFEQMSYAEIAAAMKVSTKAIERILDRARKRLATELRIDEVAAQATKERLVEEDA